MLVAPLLFVAGCNVLSGVGDVSFGDADAPDAGDDVSVRPDATVEDVGPRPDVAFIDAGDADGAGDGCATAVFRARAAFSEPGGGPSSPKWLDAPLALEPGGGEATASSSSQVVSDLLFAHSFDVQLPSDVVVTRLELEIVRKASAAGRVADEVVTLLLGGAVETRNFAAQSETWPTQLTARRYADADPLWGLQQIKPAHLQTDEFGVVIACGFPSGSAATASVDDISVHVTYCPAPSSP